MDAVKLLERCRDGHNEIGALESAINLRRDTVTRCTQRISGMPSGGNGGIDDKLGEVACEIADLERARDQRRREHGAELCAAMWIIGNHVPSEYRDVMAGWYIDGASAKDLSERTGMAKGSIRRIVAKCKAICTELDEASLTGYLPEWYEKARAGERGPGNEGSGV